MARKLKNYNPESARDGLHTFITGEESKGEFRAYCPICEERGASNSPSASFNFEKDLWNCQGKCGGGGNISTLIPQLKADIGFDFRSEASRGRMLRRRSGVGYTEPFSGINQIRSNTHAEPGDEPTEELVAAFERRLWNSPTYLKQLQSERGITDQSIRDFRIGWDGSRYTLPVFDAEGRLCNIRKYKMNAARSQDKMLNFPGYGSARLYNVRALAGNEEIVFCEGEMDCIILNQHGIPAVTHTSGASTFKHEWGLEFEHKVVYICYDNDDTGNNGCLKAAKAIMPFATEVYKVEIPIPVKGADVTDFFHREGHNAEDFRTLMKEARLLTPSQHMVAEEAPLKGRSVSLQESMAQSLHGEVLDLTVTVAGKHDPPFKAPRRFQVNCSMSKGAICQQCPVFYRDGEMSYEISSQDPALLRFLDVPEDKLPRVMKAISGSLCSDRSEYTITDPYYLEELKVANSVDERVSEEDSSPITRDVYSIGTHATPVNQLVRFVGRNLAHPKDQRLTFMAWHNETMNTSLDTFQLTDEMRKQLEAAFRLNLGDPDNQETPLGKCFEIANDISQSVTRIYGRELLHIAYDLVWHSPLSYYVEGRLIEKGWLECMVVGDTRTGKSETAIQLARHYRSGIVKSCESMSFAGLVGGNQQIGGQGSWITTWGVVPLNDRRLVVLDEVSGLKEKGVIENMSSIRSSGIAQITKINTQETSARTRLIWITNPADGIMIDERTGVGIDALRTIVNNQEDIARFDFVMAARASEVESSEINQGYIKREPRYSEELCANLVLWAWSLKPEDIVFTDSAVQIARDIAEQIGEEYVADPPLLQAENARFKLYRIAAAIAARTFHIEWQSKDNWKLQVNADHVRAAKEFLDLIYDSEGMQYRSMSRRIIDARNRAKRNRAACRSFLIEHAHTVLATLRAVQNDSEFRHNDFREFGGLSQDAALAHIAQLLQWGMLHRKNKGYIRMDKELASLLREMEREDW